MDSWHSHSILLICLERQNSRPTVLCMYAQCQVEADNKETPKDAYCKLNLPGSLRKHKPCLPSDSLNGKRNIYGAAFIPYSKDPTVRQQNSRQITTVFQEAICLLKCQAEMSVRVKDALQFTVESNLSITSMTP